MFNILHSINNPHPPDEEWFAPRGVSLLVGGRWVLWVMTLFLCKLQNPRFRSAVMDRLGVVGNLFPLAWLPHFTWTPQKDLEMINSWRIAQSHVACLVQYDKSLNIDPKYLPTRAHMETKGGRFLLKHILQFRLVHRAVSGALVRWVRRNFILLQKRGSRRNPFLLELLIQRSHLTSTSALY